MNIGPASEDKSNRTDEYRAAFIPLGFYKSRSPVECQHNRVWLCLSRKTNTRQVLQRGDWSFELINTAVERDNQEG